MTEVATSSAETMKSSPEVTKETVQKEAELLASGKRNLLCGEVTTAVNQLQEACRLLAAKHGDLDDRCGEAYLCYGSALLELSRMESGVLGNALQGIEGEVAASPESKTEESEQKIVEDVGSTDDTIEDPDKCTGEEREKVSNEVIDAMLETDEELAARQKKEGVTNGHTEMATGGDAVTNGESDQAKSADSGTDSGKGGVQTTDIKAEGKGDGEQTRAKTDGKGDGEKTEAKADGKGDGEKTEAKADGKGDGEKTEAKDDGNGDGEKTETKADGKGDGEKTEPKADGTGDVEKTEAKADEKGDMEKTEAKAGGKGEVEKTEAKADGKGDVEKTEAKADGKGDREKTEAKADGKSNGEKTEAKVDGKGDVEKTEAKEDGKGEVEKTEAKEDGVGEGEKTEAKADGKGDEEKTEAKADGKGDEEKTEAKADGKGDEEKTEAKADGKGDVEKTEAKVDGKGDGDKKAEIEKAKGEAEKVGSEVETRTEGNPAMAEEKSEETKKDEPEAMETDEKTDDAEENEEGGMDEDGDAQEETEEPDQDIDNDDEDKKDEEDVSNLQLAWEILELAKVIYSKQDTKEMKLKAAEAYLKLGEVGLETEQYEQAIGDLRECLKLQQAHLEPESRLIAETHYQIGLACLFNSQHDNALIEFRHAVKSIETKIGKLEEIIKAADEETKGKEPASMDNPIVQAQKEVKDLREILPDILAKIDDTEDEKRNQDRVKQLVKENVASDLGTTTTFGEAKSSSDVSDISVVMVRKKRKPEDEMADDSKKAKTESGAGDASNGTAEVATNGTTA